MIPKKLHYVWWGKPLSDTEKEWMETSKKNNPTLEHKIWTNEDVEQCKFLEVAIKEEKYAYAADYIRFWVLFNHGGIYIDTDVELTKKIPDSWLEYDTILPKETEHELGGHFIGSRKKNIFTKKMIDKYKSFTGETIDIDEWVIPNHIKETSIKTFGLYSIRNLHNGTFKSSQRLKILDVSEMCPYYPWDKDRIYKKVSIENSIGIHYWNTYKKINKFKLNSYSSKHFDNE